MRNIGNSKSYLARWFGKWGFPCLSLSLLIIIQESIKTLKESIEKLFGISGDKATKNSMNMQEKMLKIKEKMLEKIDAISRKSPAKQLEIIKKAQYIIDNVLAKLPKNILVDVLSGAHLIIQDGKENSEIIKDGKENSNSQSSESKNLYSTLSAAKYGEEKLMAGKRISSHHKANKKGDDMSISAPPLFNELLFGQLKDTGETWFQFEAHGMGGLRNLLSHGGDYLKYKVTGRNVGQYGLSEHVDSKPIYLTVNNDDSYALDKSRTTQNTQHSMRK